VKTIFITIFHGHIARNILLTDILKYLKAEKNLKVVILCPEFKREYYQKQFGGENIIFEGVPNLVPSRIDSIFRRFYYFFVDTATVRLLQGEHYLVNRQYFKYISHRIPTLILGNIRPLRKLIRFLDKKLVPPKGFESLFNRYKPDLVFISSITSDQDTMVLREAISRGIRTLGMVRSWDNFSVNKGNVRIYPNGFLVHNKYLLEDSVKLADFPREKIQVVGMPHFDYYVNELRLSREEITKKLGINSNRKILLFLMIGLSSGKLDEYIISILENWLENDLNFKDFELVVRPHPNTGKSVKVGNNTVINYPNIIEFKSDRTTDREFTKDDLDTYASLIAHSEVVVSYQGTAIVDTVALGKPIVSIAFDEEPGLPYLQSMRHQYKYTHLQPIFATGGVKIVYNENDLKESILDYYNHPEHDREGREKIVNEQCFILDGKASQRVVENIKKLL
jgi:hypothetical protein